MSLVPLVVLPGFEKISFTSFWQENRPKLKMIRTAVSDLIGVSISYKIK
jgi:hypothetical protein